MAACTVVLLLRDVFKALIISQVCLSVQLPFPMLPLFLLTSSKSVMGLYVNGRFENLAMALTGLPILVLNGLLAWWLIAGRL